MAPTCSSKNRQDASRCSLQIRWLIVLAGCFSVLIPCAADDHVRAADLSHGMELLRNGQVDKAMAFFEEMRRQRPRDPAVLNAIGASLCVMNQTKEATSYFKQAIKIDLNFMPAVKNLAIAEFSLGRYSEATPPLLRLLQSPSTRADAHLFLGMIAAEEHRDKDAIQHFEKVGGLFDGPLNVPPQALICFARSLSHDGQPVRAGVLLDAIEKRSDLLAKDLADTVAILAEFGRYEEALASLDRLKRLEPNFPKLPYERVRILAAAGRNDEALQLAESLSIEAPEGDLFSLLAEIAERTGKLDVAVQALRKAIELEPGSEDHYLDLSLLCTKYRNSALALEILDLGLHQLPRSYRLLVQKGIALENSENHEEAKKVFVKAMSLRQDHSVALAALAVSQILSDQMTGALDTLSAGVKRFADDFYIHYLYGFALDRSRTTEVDDQNTLKLAAAQFEAAVKLNPKFSQAYYHLGKIQAKTDPRSATRNLETALRLDPTAYGAMYQLARLYLESGRTEEGSRLMAEVERAKADKLELEQKPGFVIIKK